MDGTLLDGNGQLPEQFADVASRATAAGVTLAPASGRQLATLQRMFPESSTFLAENGTVVMYEGRIVETTAIAAADYQAILDAAGTLDVAHTVLACTPHTAFVRPDQLDLAAVEVSKYYASVTPVDDLRTIDEPIIKVAVHCAAGAEEHLYPTFLNAVGDLNVAVSGAVWMDVMSPLGNKGRGLATLAAAAGVELSRTAAFGDFLNDYELLHTAGTAVAMANAHPRLKEIADLIAPPNTEHGVIQVLDQWLP
ncbi:HAD hydrolase family protein [Corynebacterium lizhenjunii]|uniref:HAD hydrolase family protein n=2 Tax=Corynebacterium lizhenjunii TaxID=2709394 RepID=A0A7T0KGS7_9CORY|nr:HAD hydrolase family protein [Corynebacterium lizhenjunii]